MTKFAVVFLCAQALFVQNAFGQCLPYNQGGIISGCGGVVSNQVSPIVSSGCGYGSNIIQSGPVVSQIQVPSCGCTQSIGNVGGIVSGGNNGGFGGNGVGQLAIVGDIPIGGTTYVDGNLPVIGFVEFTGALPAGGYVTVVGNTPCECGNYNVYNNNVCY